MLWFLCFVLVVVVVAEANAIRPICAPPLCPEREGCRLKFLPQRICPICECPNRECKPVECDRGCRKEIDVYGCPSCVCFECPQLFCLDGCSLINVPGKPCPQCECPKPDK
uniref:U74-Liphistoxin-Lsp1c_1 n=1 Tax=Liphistius sp. SGP-2016 TaxID=1905180 RepID=A0A4Q8K7D9_9ARAC